LLYKPSGNNIVDDFIRNTQINGGLEVDMMEFVPYNRFKDIEFIAEFKVFKATWIDGNIQGWNEEEINFKRSGPKKIFLKRFENSENITSKDLNEVYINFNYNIFIKHNCINNLVFFKKKNSA